MKYGIQSLAKISPPQPLEVFTRHRLFGSLDNNRRYSGTWIGGPAGYGKTTLLSSYVTERGFPCLWYKIDYGDNDVASFFYYLRKAAMAVSTETGPDIPLLKPECNKEILVFTKRFFEYLFERLKDPYVIVFDDYQEVGSDSVLNSVLRQALSGSVHRKAPSC
jgi:ATP/maltotriose-dependent transcriptional regulator MalT